MGRIATSPTSWPRSTSFHATNHATPGCPCPFRLVRLPSPPRGHMPPGSNPAHDLDGRTRRSTPHRRARRSGERGSCGPRASVEHRGKRVGSSREAESDRGRYQPGTVDPERPDGMWICAIPFRSEPTAPELAAGPEMRITRSTEPPTRASMCGFALNPSSVTSNTLTRYKFAHV
jgi:hypothetical protein